MAASEVLKETGSIDSTENLPIYFDLYYPAENGKKPLPVILFLHGFKGFKDWGPFPAGCRRLAESGFAVVAMNFSLNGVGKNMTEFDELDLFARETLSQDLDDVGSVIGALQSDTIKTDDVDLDTTKIGIIGHSRGGHTAVCAADEYPAVQCLVTWSAVADYNARWSDKMIRDWEERGITEIKNSRTEQIMPIKKVVYEDALANADRVIALNRIKDLSIPAFFIHSKDDEAVPHTEAEKLYRACGSSDKEILLLSETGHTFGGGHPFEDDKLPIPFKKVLNVTSQWFQKYLQ